MDEYVLLDNGTQLELLRRQDDGLYHRIGVLYKLETEAAKDIIEMLNTRGK